jgi:hypothetical protein
VDFDGGVSPFDVLIVINFLNSRGSGEGEGYDAAPSSEDEHLKLRIRYLLLTPGYDQTDRLKVLRVLRREGVGTP